MENSEKRLKVELEGPQNAGIKSAGYRLPVAEDSTVEAHIVQRKVIIICCSG